MLLAKITSDHQLISHDEKRYRHCFSDSFGQTCFACSRRPNKQNTVTRFNTMSAEKVGALLLFNKLIDRAPTGLRKNDIVQSAPRHDFHNEVTAPG